MTIILAINTAMTGSSVAIARDGKVMASVTTKERGVQAAQLLLHIEDCLKKADIGYQMIDKIAVCVGPGGFTGIRVGLAAARGIALATKTDIVGFSSLELMLYGAAKDSVAILNAGRGQYYAQKDNNENILTLESENLADFLAEKNIISTDKLDIEHAITLHNPQDNAAILCELASSHKGRTPEPLYVRAPDAKIQKKLFS